MSEPSKTRALAASLRLPNLPSVWSNTLTGIAVACLIQEHGDFSKLHLALIAATSLYFAGNLLNDWADIEWDRKHRPERALPSGLFPPALYRMLSSLLVALGLGCATLASFSAFLVCAFLTACILIYTWLHKKSAWAVIPMALCRASLPVLGYACCSREWDHHAWIFLPSLLLFLYLILLSLRARTESHPSRSAKLSGITSFSLLLPPLILIAAYSHPHWWFEGVVIHLLATTPYLAWIALTLTCFRSPIPRQVSALLAGIPLIDAMILLPYLLLGHLFIDSALSLIIALAWLPAFVAGRLLQRYVPAT